MTNELDNFLSLQVNQAGTRAAMYQNNEGEDKILIYAIIDNITYPKFHIHLNSPCSNNFSFLPSDYGDILMVLTNENILLFQIPEDSSNSNECSFIPITTKHPTMEATCLKISSYPPNLYFGYIQSNNIYIYLLESLNSTPQALPIRRYILNTPSFLWFDFRSSTSIYCATQEHIQKYDLNQSAILVDQSDIIKFTEIDGNILFIDASISPIDPNIVVILFKCSNESGDSTRCGIAHFSQLNTFEWISEDSIDDPNPKTVRWSSFGSNIIINGSKTHLFQKNCSQWVLKVKDI